MLFLYYSFEPALKDTNNKTCLYNLWKIKESESLRL